jgi:hypothetical protein
VRKGRRRSENACHSRKDECRESNHAGHGEREMYLGSDDRAVRAGASTDIGPGVILALCTGLGSVICLIRRADSHRVLQMRLRSGGEPNIVAMNGHRRSSGQFSAKFEHDRSVQR